MSFTTICVTEQYFIYKKIKFPKQDFDIPVKNNQAFLLDAADLKKDFIKRYEETSSLYYNGQPPFENLLAVIKLHIEKL